MWTLALKRVLCLLFFMSIVSYAGTNISPQNLAKKLHLVAGKKAIIQWERIFKSKRKMKRYGIDKLSKEEQKVLKKYLLDHAADSDHPTVAGM